MKYWITVRQEIPDVRSSVVCNVVENDCSLCCQYWKKASIHIKPKPHLVVEYMLVKRGMYTVSIFSFTRMKKLYVSGTHRVSGNNFSKSIRPRDMLLSIEDDNFFPSIIHFYSPFLHKFEPYPGGGGGGGGVRVDNPHQGLTKVSNTQITGTLVYS